MLKNLVQAQRATRVQYPVPASGATRAAIISAIYAPRERAYALGAAAAAAPARNAIRDDVLQDHE